MERQSLLQRCIDSVNEASSTQLEGPLWLKAEGKKSWKKFHFILRDGNLFQTTKSKKGSVHDVHCVASLATVRGNEINISNVFRKIRYWSSQSPPNHL